MGSFSSVQSLVSLVLGLGALGVEIYALVDVLRQRKDAFPAAGKLTKPLWTSFLGVAVLIGIVTLQNPLQWGIFTIVAFVAAGVYLADVRPAVRQISGGGGNSGPYGGW